MITIGITCYREGEWLRECWESVLGQTDDRWEAVMVLDGGHDDRTREIFESLQHPRLQKLAMDENLGPYPCRNRAFELTRTPYHFYLDGDDQLFSDSVKIVLSGFEECPHAGFIYGDYEAFDQTSTWSWAFPRVVSPADLAQSCCLAGGAAYRSEAWRRLGGFAPELARGHADYDFHIGLMEAGISGVHCEQTIYRYRAHHSNKVSGSYHRTRHEKHEIMVRRHPVFFRDRRLRHLFLARGYQLATLSNLEANDWAAARKLSRTAIRYGAWRDLRLWIAALASGNSGRALRNSWRRLKSKPAVGAAPDWDGGRHPSTPWGSGRLG